MAQLEPPIQPKSRHTGFLDLPAELRIQIYEDALIANGHICLCRMPNNADNINTVKNLDPSHQNLCHSPIAFALLQTCHSIRNEASDVLFQGNRFMIKMMRMPDHALALDFPDHLLSKVQNIFMLAAADDYNRPEIILDRFKAMTSLKTIQISAIEHWPPTLKHSLPAMMSRAHSWKHVMTAIIGNVPVGCKVSFGTTSMVEQSYVSQTQTGSSQTLFEVPPEDLLLYARDALLRRDKSKQEHFS